MRRHDNLIARAKERGLFVRVDRATPWGNPFVLGRDGDRATVIARYRDHHLLVRADLLGRLGELRARRSGGSSTTAALRRRLASEGGDDRRTLRVCHDSISTSTSSPAATPARDRTSALTGMRDRPPIEPTVVRYVYRLILTRRAGGARPPGR
jgi:hypothetical protein